VSKRRRGLPDEARHRTLAWTAGRVIGTDLRDDDIWRTVQGHAMEWGFVQLDWAMRKDVLEGFRAGITEGHLACEICGEENSTVRPRPVADPWGYMTDRGDLCQSDWQLILNAAENGDAQ
jgi:hypothetical protein